MTTSIENHVERAIETLEGMRQIVKNDMLTRNEYVSQTIVNRKLAEQGAVCGGRKACAIGSMLLGYGVEPKRDGWGSVSLPGAHSPKSYSATRPALRAVLNALNAEATAFIENNPKVKQSFNRRRVEFDQPIEQLFEGAYGTRLVDRDTMLKLITRAKQRIRREARATTK